MIDKIKSIPKPLLIGGILLFLGAVIGLVVWLVSRNGKGKGEPTSFVISGTKEWAEGQTPATDRHAILLGLAAGGAYDGTYKKFTKALMHEMAKTSEIGEDELWKEYVIQAKQLGGSSVQVDEASGKVTFKGKPIYLNLNHLVFVHLSSIGDYYIMSGTEELRIECGEKEVRVNVGDGEWIYVGKIEFSEPLICG